MARPCPLPLPSLQSRSQPEPRPATFRWSANGIVGGGADFFTLNNGAVTASTVFLPGGTYPLKAHYQGDGTFLGSDSSATTVTVNPEPSRTTLGIVGEHALHARLPP